MNFKHVDRDFSLVLPKATEGVATADLSRGTPLAGREARKDASPEKRRRFRQLVLFITSSQG